MQFGKVSDYLTPTDIAALKQSMPEGAVDPLDMPLADYVETYRANQNAVRTNPGATGMSAEEIGARNWFGTAARFLGLPTDEAGLYTMPGEGWRSASLMVARTPGQIGYDAYCHATGGVSLVSGDKLPDFSKLREEIKAAWEAAAKAVADRVRAEG